MHTKESASGTRQNDAKGSQPGESPRARASICQENVFLTFKKGEFIERNDISQF